jgi:alpha-amylase
MLTYIYMSYGIPFFYYGTEAAFSGGNDPENREWFSPLYKHKNQLDPTLIKYVQTLNMLRTKHKTYN